MAMATMLGASGVFKVLFVYTVIIFISYQVSLAPSHQVSLDSPRAGPVRHCGALEPASGSLAPPAPLFAAADPPRSPSGSFSILMFRTASSKLKFRRREW